MFHRLSAILAKFYRRVNDFRGERVCNSQLLTGAAKVLGKLRTSNCAFNEHSGSKPAFTFWQGKESPAQN